MAALSRHVAPQARSDGRIRIRPYRPGDVDALYEAVRASIDEVAPWLPWCHPGYNRAESEDWIGSRERAWRAGRAYSFAIVEAGGGRFLGGRFLGGCGLNRISRRHRFANLGYWVRTDQTRRGVASAAVRLAARFGFEVMGLARIEIVAATGNAASLRVAEKAGARREGLLRNRLTVRGAPCDAVLFSLIPADL